MNQTTLFQAFNIENSSNSIGLNKKDPKDNFLERFVDYQKNFNPEIIKFRKTIL